MELSNGFRFNPFEHELINLYLKPKVLGEKIPGNVVQEKQLYDYDANPWKILDPETHSWMLSEVSPGKFEMVTYVFVNLTNKAVKNVKLKGGKHNFIRKAGCGTWDGQTKKTKIRDLNGHLIGERRMLSFEINEVSGLEDLSRLGNWRMHEYILCGINENITNVANTVLCKITLDYSKSPAIKLKEGVLEAVATNNGCSKEGFLEGITTTYGCSKEGVLEGSSVTSDGCSKEGVLEGVATDGCSKEGVLEGVATNNGCSKEGFLEGITTTYGCSKEGVLEGSSVTSDGCSKEGVLEGVPTYGCSEEGVLENSGEVEIDEEWMNSILLDMIDFDHAIDDFTTNLGKRKLQDEIPDVMRIRLKDSFVMPRDVALISSVSLLFCGLLQLHILFIKLLLDTKQMFK